MFQSQGPPVQHQLEQSQRRNSHQQEQDGYQTPQGTPHRPLAVRHPQGVQSLPRPSTRALPRPPGKRSASPVPRARSPLLSGQHQHHPHRFKLPPPANARVTPTTGTSLTASQPQPQEPSLQQAPVVSLRGSITESKKEPLQEQERPAVVTAPMDTDEVHHRPSLDGGEPQQQQEPQRLSFASSSTDKEQDSQAQLESPVVKPTSATGSMSVSSQQLSGSAAAVNKAETLPEGWTEQLDPGTGRTYFYNTDTHATQWERPEPEEEEEQEASFQAEGEEEEEPAVIETTVMGGEESERPHVVELEIAKDIALESTPPSTPLPDGWTEEVDPGSGGKYYVNTISNATQWERPESEEKQELAEEEKSLEPAKEEAKTSLLVSETEAEELISMEEHQQVVEHAANAAAAAAAEDTPLTPQPDGWTEEVDPGSGRKYYVNTISNATQWERPESEERQEFAKEEEKSSFPESKAEAEELVLQEQHPQVVEHVVEDAAEDTPLAPLSDGWTEEVDPGSGRIYYYNSSSNATQWERPEPEEQTSIVEGETMINGEREDSYAPSEEQHVVETQVVTTVETDHGELGQPETKPIVDDTAFDTELKPLPDGWTEELDPGSGRTYYYNSSSNATQWDRPEPEEPKQLSKVEDESEFVETVREDEGSVSVKEDQQVAESQAVEDTVTEEATPLTPLPDGWMEEIDPGSGHKYYINTISNASQWERPESEEVSVQLMNEQEQEVCEPRSSAVSEVESSTVELSGGQESPEVDAEGSRTSEAERLETSVADTTFGQPPLPDGWTEQIDPGCGLSFYYNVESDVTQWERPGSDTKPHVEMAGTDDGSLDKNVEPRSSTIAGLDQEESAPGEESVAMDVAETQLEPVAEGGGTSKPAEGDDFAASDQSEQKSELKPRQVASDVVEDLVSRTVVNLQGRKQQLTFEDGIREGDNGHVSEVSGTDSISATMEEAATETEPSGWTEVVDPDSGRTYFYNEFDGTSSWERPRSMVSPDTLTHQDKTAAPEETHEHAAQSAAQLSSPEDTSAQNDDAMIKADGGEVDEGAPDQVPHKSLEHVSPEAPSHERIEPADNLAVEDRLPDDWVELLDEASGQVYYYNETENSTSWDKPIGFPQTARSAPETRPEADEAEHEEVNRHEAESTAEPGPTRSDASSQEACISGPEATVVEGSDTGYLPPGWTEIVDPSSQSVYYYCESEGTTSWEKPTARFGDEAASSEPADGGSEVAVDSTGHATLDTEDSAQPGLENVTQEGDSVSVSPTLPAGWESLLDPSSGRTYYYHAESGKTSWDLPEGTPGVEVSAENRKSGVSASVKGKVAHPKHAVATFAFGSLCVHRRDDPNQRIIVHRPVSAAPSDAMARQESAKIQAGVFGPLISSEDAAVMSYLERQASSNQEDLLWNLILIAAKCRGRLRSEDGVDGADSPETAIVSLLLRDDNTVTNGVDRGAKATRSSLQRPQTEDDDRTARSLDTVESLLVRGRREEAVDAAVSGGHFAIGLLVATMCSREKYQHVARRFADQDLQIGTPLHTVAMLFTGQLHAEQTDSSSSFWGGDPNELRRSWRTHLAAIICNRTLGWDRIVFSLGNRLLELDETHAAHFCFMVCGCPVTSPAHPQSRLSLIGCPVSPADLSLSSDASVEAYSRTEAYEWSKRRGNSKAAIQSLQSFKVMYAIRLADMGDQKGALCYVESILDCMGADSRELDAANGESYPICLSVLTGDRTGLLAALVQLQRRLVPVDLILDSTASRGSVASEDDALGTNYEDADADVSFRTAKSNLLDVTQSSAQVEDAAQQARRSSKTSSAKSKNRLDSGTNENGKGTKVRARVAKVSSIPETNQQEPVAKTARQGERRTSKTNNQASLVDDNTGIVPGSPPPMFSPAAVMEVEKTQTNKQRPSISRRARRQQQTENNVPAMQTEMQTASVLSETPAPPVMQPPVTSNEPEKDGNGQPALPTSVKAGARDSISKPTVSDTPLSAKATKKEVAPSSAPALLEKPPSSAEKKAGFFSFGIKERMTKWLNPDATTADLGGGMEAYYDEKLKVWVFPGEDPAEKAKPIGPPPTAVPAQAPAVPQEAASETANDPLAAMMAPPQRQPAAPKAKDPLAAMMAPPQRQPAALKSAARGVPGGMKAPGSAPTAPPQFAVFQPKATATTE